MSTTYTTHIPLEVLQAYAVKHFLKDFAKLPPHTNCKTEKFGDQFKLRVGEARAISKFSKPYLKPEPVYAVVAGSGFELRREDATNSVISPHNVVFDAPFCYLYPHGVPYFSVRDLHIVLRYYFESFGQSVPVDPARSEFLLYAQQLRSACAKIADGQATGTEERESIAEEKSDITTFEDQLQRMHACYEAFKVQALKDEVALGELELREQESKLEKEKLECKLNTELRRAKEEAVMWKSRYERLREAIFASLGTVESDKVN